MRSRMTIELKSLLSAPVVLRGVSSAAMALLVFRGLSPFLGLVSLVFPVLVFAEMLVLHLGTSVAFGASVVFGSRGFFGTVDALGAVDANGVVDALGTFDVIGTGVGDALDAGDAWGCHRVHSGQ